MSNIKAGDYVLDTKYNKNVVADDLIAEASKRISGRWVSMETKVAASEVIEAPKEEKEEEEEKETKTKKNTKKSSK